MVGEHVSIPRISEIPNETSVAYSTFPYFM